MPFQNVPAPTTPGIRSEPSKRTLSALANTDATDLSTSLEYQSRLASFCNGSAPPALTQLSTEAAELKNDSTARTSGRSVNGTIRSPENSTGLPYCGSIPGM